MVTSEVPSHIDVRLIGPRTLLVNMEAAGLRLGIDLKGLKEGVTTFRRLEDRINLPGGMRVSRLSPSYVDVRLEEVITRSLKPRVVFEGKLPDGFELGEVLVTPAEVTVEGARSEVLKIQEVGTEPIVLTDRRETFTVQAPLVYAGKFSRLLSGALEVTVTVQEKPPKGRSAR